MKRLKSQLSFSHTTTATTSRRCTQLAPCSVTQKNCTRNGQPTGSKQKHMLDRLTRHRRITAYGRRSLMKQNKLLEALAVTAELTGTELSEAAAKVMHNDLTAYPLGQVLSSLHRCRRE